ncbi:MAG: hypothetical protein LQ352_008326 [Teloschistes flavicans]|nr:MAG: hypothetical protein LQ352_008326 [Teloschistes flavicans]
MTPEPLAYLLDCFGNSLVNSVFILGALYPIYLIIYRLFFSELARFPGPWYAAATAWYEFYYDIVHEGKYLFEIEKMHRQYGPIVRINPHELSINDPDAYELIYVSGSKRRTHALDGFINGIGIEDSILETVDHDLHRRRRKPLEPFFSRLGVSRIQHMLAQVVDKLAGRMEALKGTCTVVRLDHVFSALAGDIVGRICWEDKKEFLDDPDFAPEWWVCGYRWCVIADRSRSHSIHQIIWNTPLFSAFPFLLS